MEVEMARFDLTDFEWSVIQPLLPNKPRGVPRVDDRRVLNGIFWRLRTGAPWADIPERYGPHTTCVNRFNRWRKAGVWDRLLEAVSKAYDGDIQLDASKNPMRIAAELIQWVMSQGERGHVRTNAWDYSTAFAFALGFRSKASGVGIALGLTLLAGCRFGAATACQVRGFYL